MDRSCQVIGYVFDKGLNLGAGAKVNIKTEGSSQIGDKLTNQFASKGIIAKIIEDEKMPFDVNTGERYEMLLNPMVVLSRVAPNQLLEMQLSKIGRVICWGESCNKYRSRGAC